MARTFLLAGWLASLLTFFASESLATTASKSVFAASVGVYLNPNTGRFWSMDSYEGRSQDPSSLHKYLYSYADPIDKADLNGHWPSKWGYEVHQYAIDNALSFLPDKDRDIINKAVAEMDEPCYQTSYYSYIHAMSSPDHTVSQARRLADWFVRTELTDARKAETAGKHEEALTHLGHALHTLQDSTSPAHCCFQYWDGDWGDTSVETRTHIATELTYPSFGGNDKFGSALYKMTVDGYAYFKGQSALPSDFFWFWPPIPPRASAMTRFGGITGIDSMSYTFYMIPLSGY